MDRRDIVVIGGSAGGVEALMQISAGLSADFPAALFVVQHISPTSKSVLPELLSKVGPLLARHPVDGEPIRAGRIVVAPPDFHLLLQDGHVALRRGPQENRTRPAIDPLFRSAAVAFGPRVIGVVLTGLLDDGAAGLTAIRRCGGITVVQDPDDAQWPDMPRRALERGNIDHVVRLAEMAGLLDRLCREPAGPKLPVPRSLQIEGQITAQEFDAEGGLTLGQPSRLSCPLCGGVLNEVPEEGTARFRCQTGHAFTSEGLAVAQGEELERALESAARTQRDRLTLCRRMEEQARSHRQPHSAARWLTAAAESESAAAAITAALASLRRPMIK
jgi:two-component system, chemotaxis family, protein-glutamate methylesterase/glutaminase